MFRFLPLLVLFFPSPLLQAGDPGWAGKAIASWTESEAQQVLDDSPWARPIKPALVPYIGEDQRREGGDMTAEGGGKGVGFNGGFNPVGANKGMTHKDPPLPKRLICRWESALPIRAAEMKVRDTGAPDLDGEDYAIAIYGVPLKDAIANLNMKLLPEMLKRNGSLKSEGRKELKPSRVAVLSDGSSTATLVYIFPRQARITGDDQRLEFVALVGRLYLAQYFYPPQMQFEGKLAL